MYRVELVESNGQIQQVFTVDTKNEEEALSLVELMLGEIPMTCSLSCYEISLQNT